MSKLNLSVAIGDYDRNRPLISGAVQIDGVDPVFMTLSPEEIFFRALRTYDFDICELSLSSFTVKTAAGNSPYVGIPCFLIARISPYVDLCAHLIASRSRKDLKGKKVGVPEYQLTANVWARAILEDDHGVKPSDIQVGARRDRGCGPDRKDHYQAAAGRASRKRAGRLHDFRHDRQGRTRRFYRATFRRILR